MVVQNFNTIREEWSLFMENHRKACPIAFTVKTGYWHKYASCLDRTQESKCRWTLNGLNRKGNGKDPWPSINTGQTREDVDWCIAIHSWSTTFDMVVVAKLRTFKEWTWNGVEDSKRISFTRLLINCLPEFLGAMKIGRVFKRQWIWMVFSDFNP